MPIYFFWGEDDFAIAQECKNLRQSVVDPKWSQFNYDKFNGDQSDAPMQALNQSMTPVFGMGERLVWLHETTVCQNCSEELLTELNNTLPVIPPSSHLLFTSSKKPDARLKSTKLLQKYADFCEFSLIAPWKIEEISIQVRQISQKVGVTLTPAAIELLAESVGNNTRQLWTELEKLSIYQQTTAKPLDIEVINSLVHATNLNSLQLAAAIRNGNTEEALELITDLIRLNEPPLKIVATLVGQFRTWAIVKLMMESGEKDEKAIASVAEIPNPKRVYFLRQEVGKLSATKLLNTLPVLMELEFALKRGAEPLATLQTKIVQLCSLFVHYQLSID
jgi:DNA polymerase-3 subunit delta